MTKKNSIIYVNFSQYDNTGRILDFLNDNFINVLHFSFDHLRLKNGRKSNYLIQYKNKKVVKKTKLFSFRTPTMLLFLSLPIVAILMATQTIYYSYKLKSDIGTINFYFSVNAFSAWTGLFLKLFNIVDKSIFWVWDFFPISYPDWKLRLARYIYWQFDKPCMLWSDKIVFTNKKLYILRKKSKHLRRDYKPIIIPIGSKVKDMKIIKKKNIIVGFLGMLKENQGVDLWIDNFKEIINEFPYLKIEVIGSGPEEDKYKKSVRDFKENIIFYGFIEDQDKIFSIIKRWSGGLATYFPHHSNESYWGDPSKIKTYISAGVPVITTNVSYMSRIILERNAGVIITYTKAGLIEGLRVILKNNISYSKSAHDLAKEYNYQELYRKFFV